MLAGAGVTVKRSGDRSARALTRPHRAAGASEARGIRDARPAHVNRAGAGTVASAFAPGTRIQFLPGIGPTRAAQFERLGLATLEQLVRHYPRSYLDARK